MFFSGKNILLIGGTGTIGQGLLKALLPQNPNVIRIFSRDEHKQFMLQQEYKEYPNIRYLIGDVRDYNRVLRAMQDIDIVFHMAALKHVPACEYNPFEAVQTNIIGTQNVISAAMQLNVERVIVTSTDKSINPTNTYGATKLVVERLVVAAESSKGTARTVFAGVRFGNVMGSRGSVIPLFKSQLLARKPLTITDPSMTRFMMTQQQAVQLTMEAAQLAKGGELFVLKMPVIRLADLVTVLQEEVSLKYGVSQEEMKTEIIGLRAGEKMYEELMTYDESKQALELERMFVILPLNMERAYTYPNARKAPVGSYSSHDIDPIDKEELRNWLRQEELI